MPERSVSAMRAMFEAKGENTSPPSRGRSPAGSERSNGSRNVSNMRSSFVAVEKSGMLGLRRVSDAEPPADGVSPSQRGRKPLSRTSSIAEVQEDEGGLGNILKGSPFEDATNKKEKEAVIPRSVPDAKQEKKPVEQKEDHPAPVQKVLGLTQGTVNKFKSSAPQRDQKSTEQKPLSISTAKAVPKEKNAPMSAKTPTSATRSGPSLKVSSPSTTAQPAKPAPRKPTEAKEPKLSVRPSRTSLASGTTKETRAKSPAKPAPKPRANDAASLRTKPSRASLGNVDPEFLSRMSRPTQASASKTDKDAKADEKKSRQATKTPDEGFLSRMMRPTQASSSKHQEEESQQQTTQPKKSTAPSGMLERLMKPTHASTSKHEKDLKPEDGKKSTRNSLGKPAEPGFLERMSRPTAASSSKLHEKSASPVDDQKQAAATPPRTKTQIVAAIMKPKQKLDAAKAKVEEKVAGRPKSKAESRAEAPAAPAVAPEQTQGDVQATRPIYERVETEKADGVPHVSPAAAAQAEADAARAKRAVPVLAKESSRDKALDAATPSTVAEPVTNGGSGLFDESASKQIKTTPVPSEAERLPTTTAVPESVPQSVVNETEEAKKSAVPVAAPAAPAVTDQAIERTVNPFTKDVPEPAQIVTGASHEASEPAPPKGASEKATKPPSLESQDTEVTPPTGSAAAGAGDAPGPALNAGEEVIQEAKAEVAQREQERHDAQGHPKDSLFEAVAHVH